MVAVNPNTISICQSGECKRLKSPDVCPHHPEEFYMFGAVCKKCVKNAYVESISCKFRYKSEEEYNKKTILIINDSNIVFDRYQDATKRESELAHLFGGNNRMVGCGVDSKNNSNDDLIYKTRIENEDKSTQIRINETNTQSSKSDIGNKKGVQRGCKYFRVLNEIAY